MPERSLIELVVYDAPEPCPYLPGQSARMPLRQPLDKLAGEEFDQRMAAGDRRSGPFLYRTRCPSCQACEPLRIETTNFSPSRSQQRVFRRGEQLLRTEIGPAQVDEQRLQLFNQHRRQRGLARRSEDCDLADYRAFLVDTCCETFEMRYWLGNRLIGLAVVDQGAECMSAVYFYFDPAVSRLSPGVYSILKQIELARRLELRYLYLGLFVAASEHMAYKQAYRPHQRFIGGRWRRFEGRRRMRSDATPHASES